MRELLSLFTSEINISSVQVGTLPLLGDGWGLGPTVYCIGIEAVGTLPLLGDGWGLGPTVYA